jgi:hypothetical protein
LAAQPALLVATDRIPRAGFADRLAGHFERKIAAMSTAAAVIDP